MERRGDRLAYPLETQRFCVCGVISCAPLRRLLRGVLNDPDPDFHRQLPDFLGYVRRDDDRRCGDGGRQAQPFGSLPGPLDGVPVRLYGDLGQPVGLQSARPFHAFDYQVRHHDGFCLLFRQGGVFLRPLDFVLHQYAGGIVVDGTARALGTRAFRIPLPCRSIVRALVVTSAL